MIIIYSVYIIYIYYRSMFHADPVPNGLAAPFRKLMASATLQGRSGCRSHHQHLGGSGRLRRGFAVFFSAKDLWVLGLGVWPIIWYYMPHMILYDIIIYYIWFYIWYYMQYAHPPLIFQRCALSAVSQLLSALYPAKKFWIITVFWKKTEPPNTYHLS